MSRDTCAVCGYEEAVRPKKSSPDFSFVACEHHTRQEVPERPAGAVRSEFEGVGTRFIGVVDVAGPQGSLPTRPFNFDARLP